ncbi:DUF6452 family protein [Polaribacter tangerinus]|uniref:DUF6452 family protein n=1 Tax=Polaribacter tangerinus TaxID=1920034 RepID=UPI000B4A5EEF|nr:DUF6452 family protein [Polaribacter tangerinus]
MKQKNIFIVLVVLFLAACEKDDFCTKNPVTPKLIITFYDDINRETPKKVQRLSIVADSKQTDSLFTNMASDSIAIPLNSLTNQTIYTLKKNATNGAISTNEIATFTIQYNTNTDYVSRSCGFKVIFNNLEFSANSNSWIKDFSPTQTLNLDDQNKAHVQIFH